MVKGLKKFQEYFQGSESSFALIGGVACSEWFAVQGLRFRATKDIDMVLILEALSPTFFQRFKEFIRLGGYKSIRQSTGQRTYYRFTAPSEADYPVMIELFSRRPMEIELFAGQNVVPVSLEENIASLSAILMDDAYYGIVMELRSEVNGLPAVKPAGLLVLKARAWIDLSLRRQEGQHIDGSDIEKHRNDVFRLASLLPAGETCLLPPGIADDLRLFMDSFPPTSPEWPAISNALSAGKLASDANTLLSTIRRYFILT